MLASPPKSNSNYVFGGNNQASTTLLLNAPEDKEEVIVIDLTGEGTTQAQSSQASSPPKEPEILPAKSRYNETFYPVIKVLAPVIQKIRWATKNSNGNECSFWGVIDKTDDGKLLLKDVVMGKHEASSGYCKPDMEFYADLMLDKVAEDGLEPWQLACWIHTHPGDFDQPSSVDKDTFKESFGDHRLALMLICTQKMSWYGQMSAMVKPFDGIETPTYTTSLLKFEFEDTLAVPTEEQSVDLAAQYKEKFSPYKGQGIGGNTHKLGVSNAATNYDRCGTGYGYSYELDDDRWFDSRNHGAYGHEYGWGTYRRSRWNDCGYAYPHTGQASQDSRNTDQLIFTMYFNGVPTEVQTMKLSTLQGAHTIKSNDMVEWICKHSYIEEGQLYVHETQLYDPVALANRFSTLREHLPVCLAMYLVDQVRESLDDPYILNWVYSKKRKMGSKR